MARKAGLIGNNLRNWTLAARGRADLGPTAWNCHLHPSLRFSGSSNHLIHAFLAVASLGNLCPPKLLHLGTQHSVPRLFLLWLSMPPTATHQQDNSYGCSAIWRVSKFLIPLIVLWSVTSFQAPIIVLIRNKMWPVNVLENQSLAIHALSHWFLGKFHKKKVVISSYVGPGLFLLLDEFWEIYS